jgi:hypothetical protein
MELSRKNLIRFAETHDRQPVQPYVIDGRATPHPSVDAFFRVAA